MATERTEDYLEAIDAVIETKGYAEVKDISRILQVVPSSVTEMFRKLTKAGYINYEKYRGVTLTPKGKKIAKKTREKHEMLRNFLLILGIDDKTSDEDACRMEHILNPDTLDRLTKFVEFVNTKEEMPRWLEHFRYFYETGKYIECTPETEKNCPVHGKNIAAANNKNKK